MISEQSLRQTLQNILGQALPARTDCLKVAASLNKASQHNNVELSSYGFVMWALEHGGPAAVYKNALLSQATMDDYAQAARAHKEDTPIMLINAGKYVEKVFSTIQDPELCMERLEGMTFPHILYLLFAASGQPELVEKYRDDAREFFKRFPGTLQALPESFRLAGEEVLCANA